MRIELNADFARISLNEIFEYVLIIMINERGSPIQGFPVNEKVPGSLLRNSTRFQVLESIHNNGNDLKKKAKTFHKKNKELHFTLL